MFGGIENDSTRSFLIAVEKRDEKTLFIPLIKKWIEPGTVIVSGCWKAYCNLEKQGYAHSTVNHSQEYDNQEKHTNKMEGHWRQAKVKLPPLGVRKHHFSSYLAKFMRRYTNKDKESCSQ